MLRARQVISSFGHDILLLFPKIDVSSTSVL